MNTPDHKSAQAHLDTEQTKQDVDLPEEKKPVEPIRRETARVGRNDLCPCGSERKFKKCCGDVKRTNQPVETEHDCGCDCTAH